MEVLGIDIGGSGIKGAPVDVERGTLTAERHRIPTPEPSTPEAVADVVADVVGHFRWSGSIGSAFPAVVKQGIVRTAANVDESWIGVAGEELLSARTGCPVSMVNDADAAGLAEMAFGAGRGRSGVVFLLTFGTGIGSAVFIDGRLMPNTELGHLELEGDDAEHWAAARIRKAEDLSWEQWAERVARYLRHLEAIFSPDLFVIGGGVSRKSDRWLPHLGIATETVPAELANEAGIVGAALVARDRR